MVCNMPRRHQRSGCRNQWSDEQLQAALEAVRSGKMKVHAAALKFCIPSSTLYDHLKGKSRRRYGGHPTILTCTEEKEIATSCQILQEFGYPLTKDIVGIIVRDYITACGRIPSQIPLLGIYNWWCGFLSRWPKLTQRKPEHLPRQRAQGACSEVTNIEKITYAIKLNINMH